MQNRTTAIILTVASVLLCGCPGLAACVLGGLVIFGVPITTTLNGASSTQALPISYGIGGLCGAVILILIPIVVGVLTLRKKKTTPVVVPVDVLPPQEPLPPAS